MQHFINKPNRQMLMFSLCRTSQLARGLIACACMISLYAGAVHAGHPYSAAQLNEETFVFAGKCPSGETYRLTAYKKQVHGLSLSHYDYAGPAGTGTVQSEATPRVMAVRICRPTAEIISARYWE